MPGKKSVLFVVLAALTILSQPAHAVSNRPVGEPQNSGHDTIQIERSTLPKEAELSVVRDSVTQKIAQAVIYCHRCGAKNSAGSNYCTRCGEKLKSSLAPEKDVLPEKENLNDQAQNLIDQGKNDEAVELLKEYCRENPNDVEANILLAKAYLYECEQLKENGDKYYQTLVMTPFNIGKQMMRTHRHNYNYLAEALYICGKSYLINNRPLKASRFIKKAIRLNPNSDIDYYFVRADTFTKLALNAKAAAGSSELNPFEYNWAKKTYRQIINMSSSDPIKAKAYFRLGNVLSKFGESNKAQQAFRSALDFTHEGDPLEGKIRQRLK